MLRMRSTRPVSIRHFNVAGTPIYRRASESGLACSSAGEAPLSGFQRYSAGRNPRVRIVRIGIGPTDQELAKGSEARRQKALIDRSHAARYSSAAATAMHRCAATVGLRQNSNLSRRNMTIIRDPAPADENAWRRLWAEYLAFYGAAVAEEVTAATWTRVLDPAAPIFGRLALAKGSVVGFALGVLHAGTWVTKPICYLEDLFVNPAFRESGIGHALIADLIEMGRERSWSRVYWHTRSNNPARKLYDRFVAADDFVRYQVTLS